MKTSVSACFQVYSALNTDTYRGMHGFTFISAQFHFQFPNDYDYVSHGHQRNGYTHD